MKETFLAEVGGLKNTFATLITFSWFLAYPVCGRVGSSWISKYGYKGTLMRGLLVMVAGLGLFFASSYFTVFFPEANWHAGGNVIPGGFFIFLLGSFVVGASATILQVVINPYLTACHVKGTQAIQRLAIGGSANSVGKTLNGLRTFHMASREIRIDNHLQDGSRSSHHKRPQKENKETTGNNISSSMPVGFRKENRKIRGSEK